MKKFLPLLGVVACFLLSFQTSFAQQPLQLQYLSTHFTGRFNEGAAEIAAYDPATRRLFFSNAQANTIGVLDIRNPLNPISVDTIILAPYGGVVNSVAVSNGIVAVAVQATDATQNGKVIFFNTNGDFQKSFTVGALPDMLTFTPDGKKILVANEGEPNAAYTTDPEGSISVIDIAAGTVTAIPFTGFNDKTAYLRNKGIRIFGPNANVAKDVEPEYITVTPDSKRAYVTLQENNAVAVIDLTTNKISDIFPLGYKDHNSGTPTLKEYIVSNLINLPELGKPVYKGGQPAIKLGGFSGLYFEAKESNDSIYTFYTIPDRGPNDDVVLKARVLGTGNVPAESDLRPFKLPNYQARIVKLTLNRRSGRMSLGQTLLIRKIEGVSIPITGRTNVPGYDEIPVTYTDIKTEYNVADWRDTVSKISYQELPFDPLGGDFEGIVRDRDGNFWMCDENRPSVFKFSPDGTMIDRFVPKGTSALGIIDLGAGTFGSETLPAVYSKRWANRGFEAIAYDPETNIIYAFIQSPLFNPSSITQNASDVLRVLGINAATGQPVSEYVYLLERNREPGLALSRVDKIGDAVFVSKNKFLVLERDSSIPGQPQGKKYIYEVNFTGATNLLADPTLAALSAKATSTGATDKTLEMLTADELVARGIRAINKRKILNLPSIGYQAGDKTEGIALLPNGDMAVINDNDFGRAGAGLTDTISLGIVSFSKNNALDPSDQDNAIRIKNYPVLGMYQPDAIANFNHNGRNYFITANEGDARGYTGFNEEVRVSTLTLDPTAFPKGDSLKLAPVLGRLNVTNTLGDLDSDRDYDQLFAFGGRSFSIFDDYGNLVYDSGNDFEQLIAKDPRFTLNFNCSNDSNTSFDTRSDNKGPEPEGITVATINNKRYALIGLERIGGVMVYDIDNPLQPKFVSYANNRNFAAVANTRQAGDLGVEEVLFIPASQSPVNVALVVTANEISGTISIFATDRITAVNDPVQIAVDWKLYPNPAQGELLSNLSADYQVFDTFGRQLLNVKGTNRIDLSDLPAGTYVVRNILHNLSKLIVKQ
jgi:hypothetical protein